MPLLMKTGRLLDGVMKGCTWFAGFLMAFAILIVCLDVLMRYFFNSPFPGVLQITEYILLYMPFLAAAYVLKEDGHIRIDILLNRLSRRIQSILHLLTSILGGILMLVLAYYGSLITFNYYQRGVPSLKYFKIPEYLVIIILPIGFFLFALQFIRRTLSFYLIVKNGERE